jgi:hypothetical protein
MKEALQTLIERFHNVRQAWPQAPSGPGLHQEQVWYAGLAVCPVDFSQQLTKLQLSLQGEKLPEKSPSVSQ